MWDRHLPTGREVLGLGLCGGGFSDHEGQIGLAALLLSALFVAPGGQAAQLAGERLAPLDTPLLQPASVTVPPERPVVANNAAAMNTRVVDAVAHAAGTSEDLTDDVLAAYTLAVAVSPAGCHITTPMLAAIGQVESGNLAEHTLDKSHRVSTGDPRPGARRHQVPRRRRHRRRHLGRRQDWDRALGPMQIIPASWRVVGLDMDGDGVATRRTSTTRPVPRWSTSAPTVATCPRPTA